jgi:hypothetical protein
MRRVCVVGERVYMQEDCSGVTEIVKQIASAKSSGLNRK